MPGLLVNIDVPDLEAAIRFYTTALPLKLNRRFGNGFAELTGATSAIYLLAKASGSKATPAAHVKRDYARHWCPVHLDFVVDNLDDACRKAINAGAIVESLTRKTVYGHIAVFADPFGNGFCLIEFNQGGYDNLL